MFHERYICIVIRHNPAPQASTTHAVEDWLDSSVAQRMRAPSMVSCQMQEILSRAAFAEPKPPHSRYSGKKFCVRRSLRRRNSKTLRANVCWTGFERSSYVRAVIGSTGLPDFRLRVACQWGGYIFNQQPLLFEAAGGLFRALQPLCTMNGR